MVKPVTADRLESPLRPTILRVPDGFIRVNVLTMTTEASFPENPCSLRDLEMSNLRSEDTVIRYGLRRHLMWCGVYL